MSDPSRVAIAPRIGFSAVDWGLVAGVALMWGSSFLLIDIGVEHLEPTLVAWLRIAFGAATLALVPGARVRVPSREWPPIALLGVIWMAAPFALFAVAQQWIASSLAGMLNAAVPLFTAVVAAVLARRLPGRARAAGLLLGFAGVLAIMAPEVGGAEADALGVALVLLACVLYGCSLNLAGPLQQRSGSLPVIWRAQLVAMVVSTPAGLAGIAGSSFDWGAVLAVAVLGALGTALAFVLMGELVGRVGSTPASVTIYFIPVVASVLGAVFRDEVIAPAAVAGTAVVVLGAAVVSRSR